MNADLHRPTIDDFRDPARYVKVPDRNVFDAGTVRYLEPVYDENGRPVLDPKTGKQKVQEAVWNVDKGVLERLAAVNNARNRAGDFSPIAIGHNNLRNPDEQAQPPLVGAGLDYHVAWDEPHQKWMLRSDLYIRKEDFDEAKKYPYISIELHPSDGAIHPISLIRRAPKRDLGAWIFARDGRSCQQSVSRFDARLGRHVTVLQYIRDLPDTEMNDMIDEPRDDQSAMPDADHAEKALQYMRDTFPHLHHITQHPFHADMVKQYARDEEDDPQDSAAPIGQPSATPAEDADKDQPPIQNAAAFPSATNTCMPGDKDKKTMQNARTPAADAAAAPAPQATVPAAAPAQPSQFARDVQAQQYSRLAEMVEGLTKDLRDLKSSIESKDRDSAQALHFARCEAAVHELVHTHNRIVEDPDGVLARLKAVAPDKLQEEVLFFAKSLPHDIAGLSRDDGFVRTAAMPQNGFTQEEPDEDPQTGDLSRYRAAQVLQYQRDHNLWDDFEKAKKECPKNYRAAKAPVGDSPARRN